jgi:hypothetical protein
MFTFNMLMSAVYVGLGHRGFRSIRDLATAVGYVYRESGGAPSSVAHTEAKTQIQFDEDFVSLERCQ